MANDALDPGPNARRDDPSGKAAATGARYSPPFNRPEALHAGDHLTQYGMRSSAPATAAAAPDQGDGTELFEAEFSTREARNHRPRTLPNGLADDVAQARAPGDGSGADPARK